MSTIKLQTGAGSFSVTDDVGHLTAPKERWMLRFGWSVIRAYSDLKQEIVAVRRFLRDLKVQLDPRLRIEDIRPGMSMRARQLASQAIITALDMTWERYQVKPPSWIQRVKRVYRASHRRS